MKIIANFKMNYTPDELKTYLMNFVPKFKGNHDLTLCLPYTNLWLGKFLLNGSSISIGAQNICDDEDAKTTGEIGGQMIVKSGANSVLVGHIERRVKFKENNRTINKKIKIALKNGLRVILCVGENLVERNTLNMLDTLSTQIKEAFKGLYENELENIVIAYEPVWAIGKGETPQPKEVEKAVKAIRKVISEDFSKEAGEKVCVIYGGSITTKNAVAFSKVKNINGLLIGKSCLNSETFLQILNMI